MVDKSDISGFINSSKLDKKIATLTTKSKPKAQQDKIIKLQVFNSSYFYGKSHFGDGGAQNYLVFQPIYRYFKKTAILSIFQRSNLRDCLMKALSFLLDLIIILFLP